MECVGAKQVLQRYTLMITRTVKVRKESVGKTHWMYRPKGLTQRSPPPPKQERLARLPLPKLSSATVDRRCVDERNAIAQKAVALKIVS